jgi:outer membrane protein
LQEKVMQTEQDAQIQLEQSWREMLMPIMKKVDDAIKAIGEEGGYVYIFDLNTTNIPYVSETLSTDVTPAVKTKLGLK